MSLVTLSGRSGSGKSVCLHVLEDLGYYCVDNLPVDMLPTLVNKQQATHPKLAVSIDSRNLPDAINTLQSVIKQLKSSPTGCDILYLDATDEVLLRRFSETRRRHPLSNANVSLQEAIQHEKTLLRPLATLADLTIETSQLSQHQLATLVRDRLSMSPSQHLQILFQSFAFKNGMCVDADFVFDVRCLPNPYWDPTLRPLTGIHPQVIDFFEKNERVAKMVADILTFLENWVPRFQADNRSYLTVGIGCTGGQHRSVYVSEQLAAKAKALQLAVQCRHRDLP